MALTSTLDHLEVTRRIASIVIPYLADWCAVDLVEDGTIVRQEVAAASDATQAALRDVFLQHPPAWDSPHPASQAMRSGKPVLVAELCSTATAEDMAWCMGYLQHIEHLGPRSVLSVPIASRGVILGALTLFYGESGRRYAEADIQVAEALARQLAIAEENARLFEEARRASQLRDDILAVVAHDLRNPLATITTAASLIGRAGGSAERDAHSLELISRSARRMDRLIEDLLDVAAIEAGRLGLREGPLDVAAVIRSACDSFGARAAAKEQALRMDCGALPETWGDADRLHQVLANLIGNSIKFTEPGGSIQIAAVAVGGAIQISVTDDGPGIQADEVSHLFERFWQAPRTRRGGAGLGLPISKAIIEAHGGMIAVSSQPGEGTKFFIALPLRPPPADANA